jgi:ubiquinone/menaquinone biosynthesis C-methylase UbiE
MDVEPMEAFFAGAPLDFMGAAGDATAPQPVAGAAPAKAEGAVPSVAFFRSRIDSMSTQPEGSFDAIVCVGVMKDVPSDIHEATLKEFARLLKPGGHLLLTFETGKPPEAIPAAATRALLSAARGVFEEDRTWRAPPALKQDATPHFTNLRADPPDFLHTVFTVSAHAFTKK